MQSAKVGPTAAEEKAIQKLQQRVKVKKFALEYVDESSYYKAKLSTEDRFAYWDYVTQQQRQKKKKLNDQPISDENAIVDKALHDLQHFPPRLERVFNIVISRVWDYLYISFFLLFLIVVALVYDGKKIPPLAYSNLSNPDLPSALLVLMLFSQATPVSGITYFMFYHNVRTQFKAQESFGSWVSYTI